MAEPTSITKSPSSSSPTATPDTAKHEPYVPDRVDMPRGLFGSHVTRRAHNGTALRLPLIRAQAFGETKIRQVRLVRRINQDVGGLEVSVQGIVLVSIMDSVGQILDPAGRAPKN